MVQTRLLQKATFGSEFCFKFAHLVNKANTENALSISHPMSPPKAMMFDHQHLGTESEKLCLQVLHFYKSYHTKIIANQKLECRKILLKHTKTVDP